MKVVQKVLRIRRRSMVSVFGCLIMAIIAGSAISQTVNITGIVIDSSTSQGIGAATVMLVGNSRVTTTTASDGSFTLTGSAIVVGRPHASNTPRATFTGGSLVLSGQPAFSPVTVQLFNCNGECLNGLSANASASGIARFQNLLKPPGLYLIRVRNRSSERIIKCFGRAGQVSSAGIRISEESRKPGKSAADYGIRVSKSGYMTRTVSVAGEKADAGIIPMSKEQEQTGVWMKVTPVGADPSDLSPSDNSYGMGSIVGDPTRPADLYVGGSASGLWKSTDYGKTWTKINSTIPNTPRGTVIAVAGTTPATVWAAGYRSICKSIDGGVNFTSPEIDFDPYSIVVDPYDNNHLISGLHEAPGVIESTDGGIVWRSVGTGTLGGGVSVYPFFINTGNASTTRTTWFAIGQNGSSPGRTENGGVNWSTPEGIGNLEHPHGNAQIFQKGSSLWVAGGNGAQGQGVYRSVNYGKTWSRVDTSSGRPQAIVWGTDKYVYSMYAWACSKCDLGTNFQRALLSDDTHWTSIKVPDELIIGPNTMAVTYNGTHWVFVGCFWSEGLWRYVEP